MEIDSQSPESLIENYNRAVERLNSDSKSSGFIVKKSSLPDSGNGAFTLKKIQEGSIISEYTGARKWIPKDLETPAEYLMMIRKSKKKKKVIDGDPSLYPEKVSIASFINHSTKNSNTYYAKQNQLNFSRKKTGSEIIYVVAERDIEPGEELFANYGDDYFDILPN
jgi:SET domain-containing protein